MQIHSLIIYGNNGQRRDLKFNLNGVSIIAGDSATGKSSLIEIVDYCLASGECRVPDGVIRENVAWYALLLVTASNGMVFVARRGPGTGERSTHQFVILNGAELEPPDRLSDDAGDYNLDDATRTLSEYLGIRPNQTTASDNDEGKNYDITIRHAVKFCLQYQDEIASKRVLFHQQSEGFKAKGIYESLPYLLGFQTDDYIDRLAQLRVAKKELAEATRRLAEYQGLATGGLDAGNGLIAEATQVAILPARPIPTTPEMLLQGLEGILKWTPNTTPPINSSDDTLTESQKSLLELERQRQDLKSQLVATESTAQLVIDTGGEWREQSARLQSAGLFPVAANGEQRCPLCDQITHETEAELPQFLAVREQFDVATRQLGELDAYLPNINAFVADMRERLSRLDAQIIATRQRIRQLQLLREDRREVLDLSVRQAFVVGRVEQYLKGMRDRLGEGAALRLAQDNARQKVEKLEAIVRSDDIKGRLRGVADRLQEPMTKWANDLKLEFAPEPFRINFEQLTVEVSRNGYFLPLYRMGSGKNWLGCHLIAHFALHSHFIRLKRPVPRFLLLDQPTQVFYPPDEVDRQSGEVKNLKVRETGGSEDRDIVDRLFGWLFEQTRQLNRVGGFQVIITDHAELRTDEFKAAQIDPPRWRIGVNSLVPPSWLSSS